MITIVKAVMTCAGCPSQWDAWDADGNYLYLRYRHGVGRVELYSDQETFLNVNTTRNVVAGFDHVNDDGSDGVISLKDFCRKSGLLLTECADIDENIL